MYHNLINLGDFLNKLNGVHFIIGKGLCSNVYILGKEEATIIDTGMGNNINSLWAKLLKIGIPPKNIEKVIITHAHNDHVMGLFRILEEANPIIFINEKASYHIATKMGQKIEKVSEGDIINTELWPLEVIWTPGHTEGGICLYAKVSKTLFSGDTIFPRGSFGRFDGYSGNFKDLIKSIQKLTRLDVENLLPGHGDPVLKDANRHIEMSYKNVLKWSQFNR